MIWYEKCLLWVIVLLVLLNVGNGQNKCSCGDLDIRYPFQLEDGVTDHCAYRLSCQNNTPMLHLPAFPHPVTLAVSEIHYESHYLYTYAPPSHCLPSLFLKLYNSSDFPFQFVPLYSFEESAPTNLTFLDCSSATGMDDTLCSSFAQDLLHCPYPVGFNDSVVDFCFISCTRMFDLVSPLSALDLSQSQNRLTLRWTSKPNHCGVQNVYCKHKPSEIPRIMITTTGSTLLVLLLIGLILIYRHFKLKGDDEARIEQFLEDYRALKPTRFSYLDLKRITNNFKHKLGEGAHGSVYKGQLSAEIVVAVKILNDSSEGDGKDFINEVGTMGKIHHINVNFISLPDNKDIFLGWNKLQQIALGIAKGIEYLHQGCDHRILHFDINPHNVLLDHNFIPKISDFGLAKLCSKNRSTVSITAIKGTLGYIAPEVFSRNFGNVSYKSDIYSYGMLLLEMVGGRKNTNKNEESLQVLYPEWIHNVVEERDETHIHIEEEADIRIARKVAIVGLWCIQWHPVNRPSMKAVVQMLEGEGDQLKVPPTPFDTTASASTSTDATLPARRMNLELEVIHEVE
ncbi:rust resistance kinase Lr10-like [Senna tora]|uniref:Rust resistance kinase Lr10-like n=1 Tax=Senna tora TaxID=362788 RepID=A0A834WQ97_9FABA|nr:rust resistance kinase Lr10-like [Senna tora]